MIQNVAFDRLDAEDPLLRYFKDFIFDMIQFLNLNYKKYVEWKNCEELEMFFVQRAELPLVVFGFQQSVTLVLKIPHPDHRPLGYRG